MRLISWTLWSSNEQVLLALWHDTYWWYRFNSTNWNGAFVVVAPHLLVVGIQFFKIEIYLTMEYHQ
jgi:hypothetical protein